MSDQDTDHAALPCPIYAGGDCGPTPTTTVTTTTTAPQHGLAITGTEIAGGAGLGLCVVVIGALLATYFRPRFGKRV